MTTDQNLVELAATAAGMCIDGALWHPNLGLVWIQKVNGVRTEIRWNPLVNDENFTESLFVNDLPLYKTKE